jgi:superfamily II DNA or RNA helicase
MTYSIELRDYQKECLATIINESSAGIKRQLISLPTGSGKTVLMSAIAKEIDKKTLILAHREELITQTKEKLKLFWPEAKIGICKAEKDDIDQQIVIGSVQTCCRSHRLERLKDQGFELLMIDECHHSVSSSYQSIIKELGFSNSEDKLLIGVTATPMRSDKQGLGDIFQKITYSRSIGTMIKAGYLSPVIGRKILTNFNLERIKTRNGDFAIEDLSEAVNTEERNDLIVSKFKEYTADRKGIAFCVDVQHCKDLAEAFKRAGINAEAVYGDMLTDDRKKALESLKTGKTQVAMSCGILIEGFDEPSIDVILMARPTKSHGLYIQCVGRGLRLWPGKQDCFVLDFTDRNNVLDAVMSLSKTIDGAIILEDPECEEIDENLLEEIDRTQRINVEEPCDREFDILGSARFIWVPIGDYEWSLIDDEKCEIVMRPSEDGYVATLYFPNGHSWGIVQKPIPLEYCSGVCEDYARRNLKIAFADASKPWMQSNAQPTQSQIEYLGRKEAYRVGMNRGEAAIEIRKIVSLQNKGRRKLAYEPITSKQAFFLKCKGISTTGMTKLGAIQTISRLKSRV